MLNKQNLTKLVTETEEATMLNAQIISAEKNSFLIAIPIGLISGLIAYCTATIFQIMYAFVIGIGAGITAAVLLFHFKFGKHLPKQTVNPNEYGSPLSFYKFSDDNSVIQAYNRANGNPSSNFILPPNN